MLAKELKIKTLKRQREFIEEQLSHGYGRDDGNTAYRYVGCMYPEVIKYFEDEGFIVERIESDNLPNMIQGLPVYLFTISDIKLSEDELKEAESIEIKIEDEDEDEDDSQPTFGGVMSSIIGGILPRE